MDHLDFSNDSDASDVDYVPITSEKDFSEEDSSENDEMDLSNEENEVQQNRKRKSGQKQRRGKKARKEGQSLSEIKAIEILSEEEDKLKSDRLWAEFKTIDVKSSPAHKSSSKGNVIKPENATNPTAGNKSEDFTINSPGTTIKSNQFRTPKSSPPQSPRSPYINGFKKLASQHLNGVEKTLLLKGSSGILSQNGKTKKLRCSSGYNDLMPTTVKNPFANGSNGLLPADCNKVKESSSKSGCNGLVAPRVNDTLSIRRITKALNKTGKKDKNGTLEESKIAWCMFKGSEDLDDEINQFNRGKDGFLERQDFLERADFRQFEVNRGLRVTTNRRTY